MTAMDYVVKVSSTRSPDLMSQERPRQSAELVTKSIRSKLNPLEAQLHNARNLLDGTTNVFLPRKEEFILDWLLEKLKGDKKQMYNSHNDRGADFRRTGEVQADLWKLLVDLWKCEGLDLISRTGCFRRHNFAGILFDTLEDLGQRPEGERICVMEAMEQALEGMLQRNSGVKIRPQPEQTTEIFGRSLYLVNQLSAGHHDLGDGLITKFCQICQTILYEDRPTKKVPLSGTFS
jgi:hypothetical protein